MQHAQSTFRPRSLRWIGRGALAAVAGLIALGAQPALSALAGTWSAPVQLPGSCGNAVAVNQAGAMAAGGTFTAADGTMHVQVCTSPDGKTWQATDLGPGGTEPHGGQHPVMALSPDGHAVALWGSTVGCPAACSYIVQASRAAAGRQLGRAGDPQHRTLLRQRRAGTRHGRLRQRDRRLGRELRRREPLRRSPGRRQLGSGPDAIERYVQGDAHNLSLAVSPDGSAVVAFAKEHDAIWAASGSIKGGFSAPVLVAAGDYDQELGPEGRAG